MPLDHSTPIKSTNNLKLSKVSLLLISPILNYSQNRPRRQMLDQTPVLYMDEFVLDITNPNSTLLEYVDADELENVSIVSSEQSISFEPNTFDLSHRTASPIREIDVTFFRKWMHDASILSLSIVYSESEQSEELVLSESEECIEKRLLQRQMGDVIDKTGMSSMQKNKVADEVVKKDSVVFSDSEPSDIIFSEDDNTIIEIPKDRTLSLNRSPISLKRIIAERITKDPLLTEIFETSKHRHTETVKQREKSTPTKRFAKTSNERAVGQRIPKRRSCQERETNQIRQSDSSTRRIPKISFVRSPMPTRRLKKQEAAALNYQCVVTSEVDQIEKEILHNSLQANYNCSEDDFRLNTIWNEARLTSGSVKRNSHSPSSPRFTYKPKRSVWEKLFCKK